MTKPKLLYLSVIPAFSPKASYIQSQRTITLLADYFQTIISINPLVQRQSTHCDYRLPANVVCNYIYISRLNRISLLIYRLKLLFKFLLFENLSGSYVFTRDIFLAIIFSLFCKETILELHLPLPILLAPLVNSLSRYFPLAIISVSSSIHETVQARLPYVRALLVPNPGFLPHEIANIPSTYFNRDDIALFSKSFVFAGSSDIRKGFNLIVDLAYKNPECSFIAALLSQSQTELQDHLPDNIHIYLNLPTSAIAFIYSHCLGMLSPYITSSSSNPDSVYGCPVKLIEQSSFNLPLLTSDVPLTRRLVDTISPAATIKFIPNDISSWHDAISLYPYQPFSQCLPSYLTHRSKAFDLLFSS